MTTFKQFINESKNVIIPWDKSDLKMNTDALLEELKKHCSDALEAYKEGQTLYRGMNNKFSEHSDAFRIDSANSHRRSRDTSNFYQVLMDSSEKLSHVPSRSESIICTPKKSVAMDYTVGDGLYVVFPYDSVDAFACSQFSDFLNTNLDSKSIYLSSMAKNMDLFSLDHRVSHLLTIIGANKRIFMDVNVLQKFFMDMSELDILKFMLAFDAAINYTAILMEPGETFSDNVVKAREGSIDETELSMDDLSTIGKKFFREFVHNPIKFISSIFIDNSLNITISDMNNVSKYGEVWFVGKAILINSSLMELINEKL